MRRRDLILAIAGAGIVTRANAAQQDQWLITPEEYAREVEKRGITGSNGRTAEDEYWSLVPKAGPGSPQIVVRSPDIANVIRGPVKLDVQFIAAGGSQIDLASFKVKYGMLAIDVTERVKRHATLTPGGITAELSSLPNGKHSFELQIGDSLQRISRQRIRCEVGS
jgi:hypothetical protein